MSYDSTNHNFFSWRYSPVIIEGGNFLVDEDTPKETMLKHLCCYFLLFLGWLLVSLLYVRVYVPSSELAARIT